jgi:hypothetical protein
MEFWNLTISYLNFFPFLVAYPFISYQLVINLVSTFLLGRMPLVYHWVIYVTISHMPSIMYYKTPYLSGLQLCFQCHKISHDHNYVSYVTTSHLLPIMYHMSLYLICLQVCITSSHAASTESPSLIKTCFCLLACNLMNELAKPKAMQLRIRSRQHKLLRIAARGQTWALRVGVWAGRGGRRESLQRRDLISGSDFMLRYGIRRPKRLWNFGYLYLCTSVAIIFYYFPRTLSNLRFWIFQSNYQRRM